MRENETRTIGVVGINPYLAAQLFHYRLAYRQSESGSLPERIQLLEAFKHLFSLLHRYSATRIANAYLYNALLWILIQTDCDFSAIRTFLCIVQQIGKHL